MCLEFRPSEHWNATGEIILGSQCVSSGLPVAFQWCSSAFQLCKLTLDRYWDTTGCYHQSEWFQWHPSVLVAPVVFQCGMSSGILMYWYNLIRRLLGQVTSHHTAGMVRVVWVKLISFEIPLQIHKNYNGAFIKSMHRVMLKYSHV